MSQNKTRLKISQPKKTPEERYELVAKVDRYLTFFPELALNSICESCGVSPSNYRRWKTTLDKNPEYQQKGIIPTQSTRPKHPARQISEATKQRVIEEACKPNHTSANSITSQLNDEGIAIGKGKVIEILEEVGLYGTIYKTNAKGECQEKRGLHRLCENRQQGP